MTLEFWTSLLEEQSAGTILIAVLLLMLLMYIARQPAHQLIYMLVRGLRNTLRVISHAIMREAGKLRALNREILLAQGKDQSERFIEREFQRIEALINRDLSGYPSLQRDLHEQITRVDEDYVHCAEVPPQPPEWLKAVQAVAEIPDNGSPVVAKILNDIHITLKKSLEKNMQEYRGANRNRHSLLKKMMPYWQSLSKTLESVEKKIHGLEQRSVIIDDHMDTYEKIRKKTDYAERMLTSASTTQFLISTVVLCFAFMGMYVNFQLVAAPMQEVVGASAQLGSVQASDVAALFIISIEVILGLFLMEALGITRLFPIIHMLEDHKRKAIFWFVLSFLLIFASVEASLAYMHDLLVEDQRMTSSLIAGTTIAQELVQPVFKWVPAVGQMVMGFILPFVLAFVAIPLESFIFSSRSVGGRMIVWSMDMVVAIIQAISNMIQGVGRVLISLYDLVIFVPVMIENRLKAAKAQHKASASESAQMQPEAKPGKLSKVKSKSVRKETLRKETRGAEPSNIDPGNIDSSEMKSSEMKSSDAVPTEAKPTETKSAEAQAHEVKPTQSVADKPGSLSINTQVIEAGKK